MVDLKPLCRNEVLIAGVSSGDNEMAIAQLKTARYTSRPFPERSAVVFLVIAAALGWVLGASFLIVSLQLLSYNVTIGLIHLAATLAFFCYMWILTKQLVQESHEKYTLEFGNLGLILLTYDPKTKARKIRSINWKDIESIEYYSPADVESLLLRSADQDLEIPLRAFSNNAKTAIVNFIKGQGLRLVTIP